jgi:hypothetical protein
LASFNSCLVDAYNRLLPFSSSFLLLKRKEEESLLPYEKIE